ncbi:MAG TPA: SCP-2 sterol transfer family protein, partial [Mobilitalea sp.]|nr:SCP-2 sterol transfer family protein [Mobilitalea sp.]
MKVNIYYGGRGLIEDPTIYVMSKLTAVLEELRVQVTRYNLYEEKSGIAMLPKTLKEADGVILATTVEWMGIGGLMQQFLDACWLYADKDKLSKLYMLPIVMANTYGERDAELTLIKAWEMLGGIPCNGLCAYVEDHVEFETNPDYAKMIEKEAESFYRKINQKAKMLPASNTAIKQNVLCNNSIVLTPQESEQLSMYVSDDTYVKKQKEDIEELTQIFKEMLDGGESNDSGQEFIKN